MTAKPTSKRNLKSLIGVGLLATGGVLLAMQLGLLEGPLTDSFASCVGLAVAWLRLLQFAAFDHSELLSFANAFLVLFTAFAMTLAGSALLRNRSDKTTSGDRPHARMPVKGDQ